MLIEETDLFLYHLTLQKQTNYIHSCLGNFVDIENTNEIGNKISNKSKPLQICLATETHLEIYDLSKGTLQLLNDPISIWGSIRTLNKLTIEDSLDHVVITTDSGNFSIIQFKWVNNKIDLKPVFIETLFRSGMRRLSPIQYCSIDNKSRCIMFSALEKNKYCYLLNYDINNMSSNKLDSKKFTLNSPLEVANNNFVTLNIVNCEMDYIDNPCFASLEMDISKDYGEFDEDIDSGFTKSPYHLIFYMLDLNLNHIIKKADYNLPNKLPNFIFGLPDLEKYHIRTKFDENDDLTNPFVIIGFENNIFIKDLNGFYNIKIKLPQRNTSKVNAPIRIISASTQKLKNDFFILLQNNLGDLYKLKILPNKEDRNRPCCIINYFDTIQTTENFHILSNGLLYSNSEIYDNVLYQFEDLGTNESEETYSPSLAKLSNLSIVKKQKCFNPMISNCLIDKNVPYKFITNIEDGKLSILENAVQMEKLIDSPLPPNPLDLWTLKLSTLDKTHSLLVFAFSQSTIFLNVQGDSIQNLDLPNPSPFTLKNDLTLHMAVLSPNIIIQVCKNQFNQVVAYEDGPKFEQIHQWFPPAGIHIVSATSTSTQLIIALSNNEMLYFEINPTTKRSLIESGKVLTMDTRIVCIATDESLHRSDFLIAATADDEMVNIISLNTKETTFLEVIAFQKMDGAINDCLLFENTIHVGLSNGIYVKSHFSKRDGAISSTSSKFIGNKEIFLTLINNVNLRLNWEEENDEEDEEDASADIDKHNDEIMLDSCIIIRSDRIWVSYKIDDVSYSRPLALPEDITTFRKIVQFTTKDIQFNGVCSLASPNQLVIGRIQNFVFNNRWFNHKKIEFVKSEDDENNETTEKSSQDRLETGHTDEGKEEDDEDDIVESDQKLKLAKYRNKKVLHLNNDNILVIENSITPEDVNCRVVLYTANGLLVNNSLSNEYYQKLSSISCLAATMTKFPGANQYIVISTADGKLLTYELTIEISTKRKIESYKLDLLHETEVDDQIYNMAPFGHQLLVPLLGHIVLYSLGKKHLLKKSITPLLPSMSKIVALDVWESNFIALGDIHESVTIFYFSKEENKFYAIADDIVKRHVSALKFLDEMTVIGGDKFGNIWTLRLPEGVNDFPNSNEYITSNISSNIMESPYKLILKNHFYVNDIPLNFHISNSLQMSDRPNILYTGLQGTIGILCPLLSKGQIKTLKKLEDSINKIELLVHNALQPLETNDEVNENSDNSDDENVQTGLMDLLLQRKERMLTKPQGYSNIVGKEPFQYRSYYSPVKNVIDGDLCEKFMKMNTVEQNLISKKISKKMSEDDVMNFINEIRMNSM